MCVSYFRGSQSSSGPASAGPHPPTGNAPFGMPANRGSAASLTEELRKTLESSYLDGGFPNGPPGSAGGQRKASSREKVGVGCKDHGIGNKYYKNNIMKRNKQFIFIVIIIYICSLKVILATSILKMFLALF